MYKIDINIKQLFYGFSCEQLVAYYYLSKFFHVYTPITSHGKVDLIIENQFGDLSRIQVKKAKYVSSGNYKYLMCNTDYDLKTKKCNYDFLVIVHDDKIWEIPACEVDISKISLANNNCNSNIKYKWDKYRRDLILQLI